MLKIERDGLTLSFHDSGEGFPLILHHGLGADGRSFQANGLRPALVSAGFRCIIPDAAGHGQSGTTVGNDRIQLPARVDDVIAIADSLGLEQFGFYGYSMGAWVGTGLLERYGDRLFRIALAGWDPVHGAKYFTSLTEQADRESEFRALLESASWSTTGGPIEPARLDGYVRTYKCLFSPLPSLDVLKILPLLLLVGEDDPYRDSVVRCAELLGADRRVVPGDHVSAFFAPDLQHAVIDWFSRSGG